MSVTLVVRLSTKTTSLVPRLFLVEEMSLGTNLQNNNHSTQLEQQIFVLGLNQSIGSLVPRPTLSPGGARGLLSIMNPFPDRTCARDTPTLHALHVYSRQIMLKVKL